MCCNVYKQLFLNRWKELENEIVLEREDGETTFLEEDVFHKFFISPELLVGFYEWRANGEGNYNNIGWAYDLFMDEYNGWKDDCKDIVLRAETIFKRLMKR